MAMSRLFRDVDGGSLCPRGSVVCIGAFDGLHLGPQALVRHAVARAQALGVPAVALSFEPLPREFFSRQLPPPRLTLVRGKYQGLRELGVDGVGLLRFDARLAGRIIHRLQLDVPVGGGQQRTGLFWPLHQLESGVG